MVRFVRSVMIVYILRTFHSVPAYYVCSTTTVQERLLMPTVCTLHTMVIILGNRTVSSHFVKQNRFEYVCYHTNNCQMLHCALKRSSYWPWYCLNSKQRLHKVCVDKLYEH